MSEEQYDGWELDEGMAFGEGVLTINEARFGFDADYKDGEAPVLILDGDLIDDDGNPRVWHQLYSIGTGWEIVDGGARIELQPGFKRKGVSKQSKYGLWITGAIEAGATNAMRSRGRQTEATVWPGMKFEVRQTDHNYGGEIGTKKVLVPVKFLGESGSTAPTTSAITAAPAPTVSEIGGALKAKLTKLAKECDSHDIFIERAFVEMDIDGNKAAEALVADSPDFYLAARG